MTIEEQIEKFVAENDLKLFLESVSLSKHAEMVIRIGVRTNIHLMRGLAKQYQVWSG